MKLTMKIVAASAMMMVAGVSFAQKGETVKMVRIDPLTGLLGPVGVSQIKGYQFFAEKFSGAGNPAGVKFEVTPIDNKLSPAESLNALKAAIDQGARYIIQGNGSSVAMALTDAVTKHNERNPGKEVLYLNDSAVDPDLTNSKCSYWHFRFDADTSMKMEAMSSFMADQKDIKKVYLLNQNYSHGHQVAKYAKESLARKRPDIQIVGEDLHPLAQTRDFAPYIAKIKASGADTVITGNWGSDLSLLIKAANENGYTGKFFTYYAGVTGTPTALGNNGAGRVYQIAYNHYNMGGQMDKWMKEFNAKYNDDFYTGSTIRIFEMLGAAMAKAKSTDPVKVAAAMEGLKVKSFNGEVEMRKTDHQLQQPLYMSVWQKADAKYPYSPEKTGMTMAPLKEYPNYVSSTPTSCQMKRP
ncbi:MULTISPECIES: branched-chain amino acid ABC transporter substrate-binding protein [unclassified Polaromonas]|jgi:branched-chain amino acid transport system substrate-binding protein|uniref:branched-chain amino acid ABC transporter substrate-binding protein n=1 Tax=unclassified Polaromonas TaxID=2638319 RepID=UPI000BD1F690|nr:MULTISPECIES: branched-chain amino acid ABC transporter substrate-binding protein [unclassified Polaromonas]OYY39246.1 MAG: branched-chain amino acid ABC transporter substrate-binding protein [Polaromonas sp. 35-63-35]OYZ20344.1 MAG: branched-chain amino acid ABC transporter substrate-binding protein [Polaromonas sp. 16-63-31]OYZ80549.1 MAG: branched-chain amino acid ABC transporter substrate-binding protein [Polaromonas sp. 24-63-21]OZA51612.1 MAG: branched-chain amino acid ABC transporter 